MGAGITLLRAWANAGTQIKPSDAKIDLGWLVGEQPAVEWENERMYARDTFANTLAEYLNTGIPISDLLSGNTTVQDSYIKIEDTARSISTTHGRNELKVKGLTQEVTIHTDGISYIDSNLGSVVGADKVLNFSLSGVTWTSVSGVFYASVNIVTNDAYYGPEYAPYFASVVGDYPLVSGEIAAIPVLFLGVNDDGTGKIKITNLSVDPFFDPNDLTNPRLYVRSSSVPSY